MDKVVKITWHFDFLNLIDESFVLIGYYEDLLIDR